MVQHRSRCFPGYDVRIVRMFAAGTFVTDLHIPDYLQAGGNVLQRLPNHFLSYGFQLGATLYTVGFFFRDIQNYLFFRQPVSYHFPFGFWLPYLYFVPGYLDGVLFFLVRVSFQFDLVEQIQLPVFFQ